MSASESKESVLGKRRRELAEQVTERTAHHETLKGEVRRVDLEIDGLRGEIRGVDSQLADIKLAEDKKKAGPRKARFQACQDATKKNALLLAQIKRVFPGKEIKEGRSWIKVTGPWLNLRFDALGDCYGSTAKHAQWNVFDLVRGRKLHYVGAHSAKLHDDTFCHM